MHEMRSLALLVLVACGSKARSADTPVPIVTVAAEPPVAVGRLDGAVTETATEVRARFAGNEVPLETLPIAAYVGLPMTGKADFVVDVQVPISNGERDYRAATGRFSLRCRGCTLGDDVAKLHLPKRGKPIDDFLGDGIYFGHLTFDRLAIRVELANGKARVSGWKIESPDLALVVDVTLELAKRLEDSSVTGCIRFKPTDALRERDPRTHAAFMVTGAPLAPDGQFHIKLAGTYGDLKKLGVACDP